MLAPIPAVVFQVAQEKPPPADSLAAAWSKLHWSVPERGPLLLIEGNGRYWGNPDEDYWPTLSKPVSGDQKTLPPAPRAGYNLAALLPSFDCTLLRLPSLSVVVPNSINVFSPKRPDPNSDMVSYWNWCFGDHPTYTGSEAEALRVLSTWSEEQWRQAGSPTGIPVASLPVAQQRVFYALLHGQGDSYAPPGFWERLHLVLRRGNSLGREFSQEPGVSLWVQIREDRPAPESPDEVDKSVPNRLRPTHLPFTHPALQTKISLANTTMVAALVQRIAAASQLPLVVDGNIARRKVQARGESAVAGDVLRALCQALGGTVRKVTEGNSSVYLLTDELLTQEERDSQETALFRDFHQKWDSYTKDIQEKTLARSIALGNNPATALLPNNQAPDTPASSLPIVLGMYWPEQRAVATLWTFHALRPLPERPRVHLGTTRTPRALLSRLPKDATQCASLVAKVVSYGFTELRVPVFPHQTKEPALVALGKACLEAKLGLIPVVPVLQATTPEQVREHSSLGVTYAKAIHDRNGLDLVTPESADATELAQRVASLARLPGVTGVGLSQLAAPGYRNLDEPDRLETADNGWRPSGLPGQRVAFLKKHQWDSGDLEKRVGDEKATLAWNQLLWARRDALMARLDAALKAAGIPVPLFAQHGSGNWFPWRGRYPQSTPTLVGQESILCADLTRFKPSWATRVERVDREPEPLRRELQGILYPETPTLWGGIVLDFDPLPLEDALTAVARTLLPLPTNVNPNAEKEN